MFLDIIQMLPQNMFYLKDQKHQVVVGMKQFIKQIIKSLLDKLELNHKQLSLKKLLQLQEISLQLEQKIIVIINIYLQ